MNIAENITKLIGNTPLCKIESLSKKCNARIIGKIEYFNPLSSVKDRIAYAMIQDAKQRGELKEGGTIVEPTSGNTGIGLAYVAASQGYRCILTMPETMSEERQKLLKALGAKVRLTPGEKGMRGAIEMAEEILKETPNSYMPLQFKNPVNPAIHRETTAQEIWRDTEGKFDFFVAGVGTGGTITGCGEVFKEKNPDIQIIAIEPKESAVLSGQKPGPHKIQGIGAGFIPDVMKVDICDEIVGVASAEAIAMVSTLAKEEGILIGASSGAALVGACEVAQRPENAQKSFVVMLPDSGERYLSTMNFTD